MFAARTLVRRFHASAARAAAPKEAATAAKLPELTLNFAAPTRAFVNKKEVKRVTVPSRDGALGLERNAPPLLAELRPGVVRVE
jgi:F-type H+-transporting ATPase subunit delta